jgi:hypothetical protein
VEEVVIVVGLVAADATEATLELGLGEGLRPLLGWFLGRAVGVGHWVEVVALGSHPPG